MNGPNRHPAVMFEIIARDKAGIMAFYTAVFGWSYRIGETGFAFVDFEGTPPPLLGGIGQAMDAPGFEPGHSFYILVDDLDAAIARAVQAGGARHMDPAGSDGYRFAMIQDPEGNAIGLIEPFAAERPGDRPAPSGTSGS